MTVDSLLGEAVLEEVLLEEPVIVRAKHLGLEVLQAKKESLKKLIRDSHDNPMDYLNSMPWNIGVDKARPPKNPKYCWFFGTKYYDLLTDEQKHEVLWLQVANDVSGFIRFEQMLPVIYMGYINKYHRELPVDVYDFLMIFSKEEIVHTMVFRKYLKLCGLELVRVQVEEENNQLLASIANMPPVIGVLLTLLIEWFGEQNAIWNTKGDDIDPLTKELFRLHHIDESRHIAFARWIVESHVSRSDEQEIAALRSLVKDMMHRLELTISFNPCIALHTSFELPIGVEEAAAEAINEIRNSAVTKRTNQKKYAVIYTWLKKIGLW